MIVFVCTHTHRYTHRPVAAAVPAFRVMSYPVLLARQKLPRATYIFSDLDRLGFWQLELAAHAFRSLRAAGLRVLNDPARILNRLGLLQGLHETGINSFRVWPAHQAGRVDRFPVFLRTIAAHRGVQSDLLADAGQLRAALDGLLARGFPLQDLMVVEYRSEPLHDDIFRKLAIYRVGAAMVPALTVHERRWAAKDGEDGVAREQAYADDLERARSNPHAEPLRAAFEQAGVDYGRADFGVVGGRIEVYEINTNPHISGPGKFRVPARAEAAQLLRLAHLEAIAALDTAGSGEVAIPLPELLQRQRRRSRLLPGYQWLP